VPNNGYDFLVFSQKGYAELVSPAGTLSGLGSLGYATPYSIPSSNPIQTDYWERYPQQGAGQSNFAVPLTNGTIEIVSGTTLKVVDRLSVGTTTGFVGVYVSPNEQLAAIVDGPTGVVTVFDLVTLQTVWTQTFLTSTGATQYPCDVYWAPNGAYLAIPMRMNGATDAVNATTGDIVATANVPVADDPVMITVGPASNIVGVELGNKTDVFYSFPSMTYLGHTNFPISTFTPVEGLFTPNEQYYLEVSSATNVVEVISTSSFAIVNTIDLPASASPGLSSINITPDGLNAYVVMHGTPATGGIIYLLSLANVATATGPTESIALSTSIGTVIPITAQYATYLEDYVLLPPVPGQTG
jgi:WD40 repeat protein